MEQPAVKDVSELALALILLSGFVVKIFSSAWRADSREPERNLNIWMYLLEGPRKWRVLGSLQLTIMMIFVVPDAIFYALMNYTAGGHRIGNIAVALLGFAADDIFAILHAINDKIICALAARFGLDYPTNGNHSQPKE